MGCEQAEHHRRPCLNCTCRWHDFRWGILPGRSGGPQICPDEGRDSGRGKKAACGSHSRRGDKKIPHPKRSRRGQGKFHEEVGRAMRCLCLWNNVTLVCDCQCLYLGMLVNASETPTQSAIDDPPPIAPLGRRGGGPSSQGWGGHYHVNQNWGWEAPWGSGGFKKRAPGPRGVLVEIYLPIICLREVFSAWYIYVLLCNGGYMHVHHWAGGPGAVYCLIVIL